MCLWFHCELTQIFSENRQDINKYICMFKGKRSKVQKGTYSMIPFVFKKICIFNWKIIALQNFVFWKGYI